MVLQWRKNDAIGPGWRALSLMSRCQMLASILYPGFGRMTCCWVTGGDHSWCSWIGGHPPCHELDAPLDKPCIIDAAAHTGCCASLGLWGPSVGKSGWILICVDSPSKVRFPGFLLLHPCTQFETSWVYHCLHWFEIIWPLWGGSSATSTPPLPNFPSSKIATGSASPSAPLTSSSPTLPFPSSCPRSTASSPEEVLLLLLIEMTSGTAAALRLLRTHRVGSATPAASTTLVSWFINRLNRYSLSQCPSMFAWKCQKLPGPGPRSECQSLGATLSPPTA